MIALTFLSPGVLVTIGAVVGGLVLVGFLLRFLTNRGVERTIFQRDSSWVRTSTIPHEQHYVRNAKGDNLDFWWFPHPVSKEALIYLHGRVGRLAHFYENLCEQYNVLSPSYPGFGISEGVPTVENVYETAELAYQWLLKKGFEENQIIIWGHSMGGAPAVYVASLHPKCKKLIIINSFNTTKGLIRKRWGFLTAFFSKPWFDSNRYAKNVECKVVQFCYKSDQIVPYEECRLLFNAYKTTNKKLVDMEGEHHEFFEIEFTAPY
jgi:uncharacterized protein